MMVKAKSIFLLIVLSILVQPITGWAQIQCASMFSDNMILQRGIAIPVWGQSESEVAVVINLGVTNTSTLSDKNGIWKVDLPEFQAGGPYIMTIVSDNDTIIIKNVLIGDVWFASGQSNMTHPMSGWDWIPDSKIYHLKEELEDANYSQIRLYQVPKYPSPHKMDVLHGGKWEEASASSVAQFSALGWFFGKELYKEFNVPIGIIHSSWGGTKIETWMSHEALNSVDGVVKINESEGFNNLDWQREVYDNLGKTKQRRMQISYPLKEVEAGIIQSGFDDSSWSEMDLSKGEKQFSSIVWLRKEIDIPDYFAKDYMRLSLGSLDRQSNVYFNGKELGYFLHPEKVSLIVPRSMVLPGRNVITIRIGQPWSGAKIAIQGNDFSISNIEGSYTSSLLNNWRFNDQIESVPPALPDLANEPTYLFNGMVNPVIPYAIKGIIWNQLATSYPELYGELFKTMILDWRDRWKQKDLPFLFFQSENLVIRQQQEEALKLPQTYKVVSFDLEDQYDVHPKNKREFAHRIALQVKKNVYGIDVVSEGPIVQSYVVRKDTLVISYQSESPLINQYYPSIMGFELAGNDGQFHLANARLQGDQVFVLSPAVKRPTLARYAWNHTIKSSLYNTTGFPAQPFFIELKKRDFAE